MPQKQVEQKKKKKPTRVFKLRSFFICNFDADKDMSVNKVISVELKRREPNQCWGFDVKGTGWEGGEWIGEYFERHLMVDYPWVFPPNILNDTA